MNTTPTPPATVASSHLVAAIETTWHAIQQRHPDVPNVVVTLGGGQLNHGIKLGHFATNRWIHGTTHIHELFIGGEGLARGATAVLGTLLHEATHGTATTRGIHDTSRQGRYHNTHFRHLAEEHGLTLDHDPTLGWSTTLIPENTTHHYRTQLATLRGALTTYRLLDPPTTATRHNGSIRAICYCGRKIRLAPSTYLAGPILCSICGTYFLHITNP